MLRAPALLTADRDFGGFDSGVPSLDEWPRRRALRKKRSGAFGTFVLCDDSRVMAYHALAASAVALDAAPGRFRRNLPDPIPVAVLGRLATARSHRRQGLGRAMFQDAARRVVDAADRIGIRGLLVHAISEEAKACYLGLSTSPIEPMTLMVTIADLRAAIA